MTTLFWVAISLIVYVYAGYPALLLLLSHVWPRRVHKAPITPTVTLIISAYNEEASITAKLDNTLELDYPPGLLDIIVASDGSTDGTNRIVEEQYAGRALLLALPREGKTAAQNAAAAVAKGEILVFSDATAHYDRGAIRAMVANYADPTVGCVGGDLQYGRERGSVAGQGRLLYWNYEAAIRRWESQVSSVIGATGCMYSLRKELYVRLDPSAISDFVQPAKATLRGFRSLVENEAICHEGVESTGLRDELSRRARVVLRGMRGIRFMPGSLNPLLHPWICFQLVSHRLLRWGVPILMIVAFVTNLFLLDQPFYMGLLLLQLGLYASAGAALVLDRHHIRTPGLFIPLYFCMINLAPLVAIVSLLRGEKRVVWETERVE